MVYHGYTPKPWIPNSHVDLKTAISLLGEVHVVGWDGREIDTQRCDDPPDPPWLWRRDFIERKEPTPDGMLRGDYSFITISEDGQVREVSSAEAIEWWEKIEPVLVEEWHESQKVFARWREAEEQMRNALAVGKFPAFVLQESGFFHPIPTNEWVSSRGGAALRVGQIEFSVVVADGLSSYKLKGAIVLKEDFLSMTEARGDDQVATEQLEAFDWSRFPYLQFMARAALNGPFLPKGRTPKKAIEGWLRDNWPAHLGEPTPTKVGNLASLLRRPEDEKGGNIS